VEPGGAGGRPSERWGFCVQLVSADVLRLYGTYAATWGTWGGLIRCITKGERRQGSRNGRRDENPETFGVGPSRNIFWSRRMPPPMAPGADRRHIRD
jgi:hypothetical protein